MSVDSLPPDAAPPAEDPVPPIRGRRVRLMGRFVSVSRRETAAAVERRGGLLDEASPDWIVVGEQTPDADWQAARRDAAELGAECVAESEFWRLLGLVDDATGVRRLYSPAMLAELVDAPLAAVRRWARRGVLRPACHVNRLAYFDFEEARIATLLAALLREGGSLASVDRRVDRLVAAHPRVTRPLAELPLAVLDGQFVIRGEGLAEATGQRCFLFDPSDGPTTSEPDPEVIRIADNRPAEPRSLRERAWDFGEAGLLTEAIEAWRLAMLESPPAADDHFTLGEWLYQSNQPQAARERYYAALEADPDHLEARVSLGCVLADLGDDALAIASLRGAVEQHADFADAHYHLARLHHAAGRADQAEPHWSRFLEIAPDSPWAEEAREALGQSNS